jgi:peroxiredoxin
MKFLSLVAAVLLLTVSLSAQTQTAQPTFAAPGMDGKLIDMAQLRGKVVVVNLWFINCPNCVQEIKMLNQLVDDYKDNKDVVFIGLASSNKADLEKFLKKNPFKYQVVPDAMMIILSKFGTPDQTGEINIPFPMHYVIDREGDVLVKAQGIKGIGVVKNELQKQFASKAAAAN